MSCRARAIALMLLASSCQTTSEVSRPLSVEDASRAAVACVERRWPGARITGVEEQVQVFEQIGLPLIRVFDIAWERTDVFGHALVAADGTLVYWYREAASEDLPAVVARALESEARSGESVCCRFEENAVAEFQGLGSEQTYDFVQMRAKDELLELRVGSAGRDCELRRGPYPDDESIEESGENASGGAAVSEEDAQDLDSASEEPSDEDAESEPIAEETEDKIRNYLQDRWPRATQAGLDRRILGLLPGDPLQGIEVYWTLEDRSYDSMFSSSGEFAHAIMEMKPDAMSANTRAEIARELPAEGEVLWSGHVLARTGIVFRALADPRVLYFVSQKDDRGETQTWFDSEGNQVHRDDYPLDED